MTEEKSSMQELISKIHTPDGPHCKLYYYPVGGRAAPIRLLFKFKGVYFEDIRGGRDLLTQLTENGTAVLGSWPVLSTPDIPPKYPSRNLHQSNAILRYLGMRWGVPGADEQKLFPIDDPSLAVVVDMILTDIEEAAVSLKDSFGMEGEAQAAKRKEMLATGMLGKCFRAIEGLISDDGPFCLGARISVADFKVATTVKWFRSGILNGFDASSLDPFPKVCRVAQAVLELPEVVAFYEEEAAAKAAKSS